MSVRNALLIIVIENKHYAINNISLSLCIMLKNNENYELTNAIPLFTNL